MVIKIDKQLVVQFAVLALLIFVTILDIKFQVPVWKFFVDGLLIGATINSIFMLRLLNLSNDLINNQHELIEKIMSDVVSPINDVMKASVKNDLDMLKEIIRKAQDEETKTVKKAGTKTGKKK